MKKPTAESKPLPPPQEERDDPEPRSLSPEGHGGEGDDEAATSTDNYESYDENNRGGGGGSEKGGLPWKQREILTFDIPVSDRSLNETKSAQPCASLRLLYFIVSSLRCEGILERWFSQSADKISQTNM